MLNTMLPIFACGPVFPMPDSTGVALALAMVLLIKPSIYLAFIQAFRFRVSSPVAMSMNQAGVIAGLRYAAGGVLIALLVFGTVGLMRGGYVPIWAVFVPLVGVRAALWYGLGYLRAGLRGQRLAGFAVCGTIINIAFDFIIVFTAFAGFRFPVHATFFFVLGTCLVALHVTGKRELLLNRFADAPHCPACGYNLTGNLSGVCPECGAGATSLN